MSTQKEKLANGHFGHAFDNYEDEPVDTHRQCANCGSHVSENFARVFAGNDDIPHACPECATSHEIFDGAAAGDCR